MVQLKLSAGGKLDACYPGEGGKPTWVPVRQVAHRYLFDEVELDPSTCLQDVFELLVADPVLVQIYQRESAAELLAHAQRGHGPTHVASPGPGAIEYLELYQVIEFDTDSKTVAQLNDVSFHGIGYELAEDLEEDGFTRPKGSRIQWGIGLTDLHELLPMPLRVKQGVVVCEGDLAARRYGHEVFSFNRTRLTLGQVLHGVLWELSFYGTPETQDEFVSELGQRLDDVKEQLENEKAGRPSTLVSIEDLFKDFYQEGVRAMFEATGNLTAYAITSALRQLEDDEAVPAGLARVLGDAAQQLVFKNDTANLPARAFRKALQQAG